MGAYPAADLTASSAGARCLWLAVGQAPSDPPSNLKQDRVDTDRGGHDHTIIDEAIEVITPLAS